MPSAEGAARADELIIEAEGVRAGAEALGAAEAERLVTEAKAVRERILGDLARRRATLREQVEQLHAARERLLGALADLRGQVDGAAGELRAALPEAKAAADAAARRVAAEPLPTPAELEAEIAAIRAAGLDLGVAEPEQLPDRASRRTRDRGPRPTAVEAFRPRVRRPSRRRRSGENGSAEASAGRRGARTAFGDGPGVPDAPRPDAGDRARTSPSCTRSIPRRRSRRCASSPPRTPASGPSPAMRTSADAEAVHDGERGRRCARRRPGSQAEPGTGGRRPGAPAPSTGGRRHGRPAPVVHAPPRPEAIDELFARLKAGREERKPTAERRPRGSGARRAARGPTGAEARGHRRRGRRGRAGRRARGGARRRRRPSEDAAELARRDAALGPARDALAKRLKRQLADEQNEVLDSLRRGDARPFVIADADDHAAGWALAAAHDLAGAADIGAAFRRRRTGRADLGGGGRRRRRASWPTPTPARCARRSSRRSTPPTATATPAPTPSAPSTAIAEAGDSKRRSSTPSSTPSRPASSRPRRSAPSSAGSSTTATTSARTATTTPSAGAVMAGVPFPTGHRRPAGPSRLSLPARAHPRPVGASRRRRLPRPCALRRTCPGRGAVAPAAAHRRVAGGWC